MTSVFSLNAVILLYITVRTVFRFSVPVRCFCFVFSHVLLLSVSLFVLNSMELELVI